MSYGQKCDLGGHSDLDFDHQNQFIIESKWMIEPNLKEFSQGFPEISGSQELDRWTDGQTENMMLQDTAIAKRHKNYLDSVHSAVNDKKTVQQMTSAI